MDDRSRLLQPRCNQVREPSLPSPEERKEIAEYLYGERERTTGRIAKALDVPADGQP